jgi:general secretion pathway protein H
MSEASSSKTTDRLRARLRAAGAGLTLVEILIVLALIALFSAVLIAGSGQVSGAKLRKSATMVSAAVRVAYTRATVSSRSVRLVLDFEQKSMWMEEADAPMLVRTGDTTGGADPVTAAEQQAVAEGERIVKGPQAPRPHFRPVSMGIVAGAESKGQAKELPSGIKFRSVQAAHDTEPRTEGRAYLYFWPGGMTERAVVQVVAGDKADADVLSVMVSPLTGSTLVKNGPQELKLPTDDRESSEREDRGGP